MTATELKNAIHAVTPGAERNQDPAGDEFLSLEDLVPVKRDALQRELRRTLAEIGELTRENRWEDLLALVYPIEKKIPELVEGGLDTEVRAKAAFALGHLNRFDEAIRELSTCVRREPADFWFHSSLAYNAYNSLYAASNREVFLRGKPRAERILLAHRHFQKARELRPDGVTNFYREGMLFKQIEKKAEKAIPLLEKAVQNWESLDAQQKTARVRERKNYIKALYQLSSALLEKGSAPRALQLLKRCISRDERSAYLSLVYKYFALGKVYFHLNSFQQAKDALVFAAECEANRPVDFIYELLARTCLAMGDPGEAMKAIERTPEKKRRPYYRWTEADTLCALRDFSGACRVLRRAMERDRRSRHKALIRLARIEYLLKNFQQSMDYAADADRFFREKWGGVCDDALFWQGLCAHRLGMHEKAMDFATRLKTYHPRYPKLELLLTSLGHADDDGSRINGRGS